MLTIEYIRKKNRFSLLRRPIVIAIFISCLIVTEITNATPRVRVVGMISGHGNTNGLVVLEDLVLGKRAFLKEGESWDLRRKVVSINRQRVVVEINDKLYSINVKTQELVPGEGLSSQSYYDDESRRIFSPIR